MGLWDEIVEVFKSKSERDEERSEDLKNALEQEGALTEQLEELERQYPSGTRWDSLTRRVTPHFCKSRPILRGKLRDCAPRTSLLHVSIRF